MGIIELLLIAVGLSMDAFAVSLCKGLQLKRMRIGYTMFIAGCFGLAQGIMPLAGWLLGSQFEKMIRPFDHWIVFVLLSIIGIKMIIEAVRSDKENEECSCSFIFNPWQIIVLAAATSIDALAVGVSFAFLQVNIIFSSIIISIVTFLICTVGIYVGVKFGMKYKKKAEITGGVVLISIGIKIILEHLVKHI